MRLGILSDSHDRVARVHFAVNELQELGAEVLIHCGDITGPEVVAACAILPSYFVFGNNDADDVPALRRAIADLGASCLEWGSELTLADKRVAVAHGHLRGDVRRLLAAQPDYMLSGHSHVAADWQDGVTRRINPGALHRAARFTVALLDLATGQLQFIEVPASVGRR